MNIVKVIAYHFFTKCLIVYFRSFLKFAVFIFAVINSWFLQLLFRSFGRIPHYKRLQLSVKIEDSILRHTAEYCYDEIKSRVVKNNHNNNIHTVWLRAKDVIINVPVQYDENMDMNDFSFVQSRVVYLPWWPLIPKMVAADCRLKLEIWLNLLELFPRDFRPVKSSPESRA
jgi:hypothetical protein